MPKVTIQNIKNTKTPDGPLELRSASAVTFTGELSGSATADGELMVTAASAGTVAGVQYTFRFTLENPSIAQDADQLHVAVDTVTQTTTSGREVMTSALAAELAPMKIRTPEFFVESSNITQSSPYPCDTNTITLSLTANVYMFASCWTQVIVTKLTNTQSDYINGTMFVSDHFDLVSWDKSTGTMVMAVKQSAVTVGIPAVTYASSAHDDVLVSVTRLEASFEVKNPAVGQVPPGVEANGFFNNASYGWSVGVTALDSGLPTASVNDTQFGYAWNGATVWTEDQKRSSRDSPLGILVPVVTGTLAGQSSPWPCDDNILTVIVQSNVPFVKSCSPVVTITGLTGLALHFDGDMLVTFHAERQAHVDTEYRTSARGVNGTFDSGDGSLTIPLRDVLIDRPTTSAADVLLDVLFFTVAVVNPDLGGNYGSAMELAFTTTDDADLPGSAVTSGPVFKDTRSSMHSASPVADYATPAFDWTGAQHDHVATIATYAVETNDASPLYIRHAGFEVKEIAQTSPYPCDTNNIISVTLKSLVPLFPADKCSTPSMVTISGLKGADTATGHLDVNLNSADGIEEYGSTGFWNKDLGTMVFNVTDPVIAGVQYFLSWKVTNQAAGKNAVDVGVIATPQMPDGAAETAATPGLVGTTTFLTPEYTLSQDIWNATAQDL
ncbi:hypothetical protein T484DRAFT_3276497, partial [Baffinella frigidus]